MFKKLRSRKGSVLAIIVGSSVVSTLIAGVVLTPSHRVRRAIEARCGVESFRDADEACATRTAALPANEIMALIVDR